MHLLATILQEQRRADVGIAPRTEVFEEMAIQDCVLSGGQNQAEYDDVSIFIADYPADDTSGVTRLTSTNNILTTMFLTAVGLTSMLLI